MKATALATIVALVTSLPAAAGDPVPAVTCDNGTFTHRVDYVFTETLQQFVVPAGVVGPVHFDLYGAQGGTANSGPGGAFGGSGGLGGAASGDLTLLGGTTVTLFVGGRGTVPNAGFNGGGTGGNDGAAGGGGATDVRVGGELEANRVLVAGGGGGGGRPGCEVGTVNGGFGGHGGAGAGSNGDNSPDGGGGFAGTAGVGGAPGIGCAGFLGAPGTVPDGGAGQTCCCFSQGSIPGGGGGGGGLPAGGGGGGGSAGTTACSGNNKGAGGGGGGGTSFAAPQVQNATFALGAQQNDGRAVVCYSLPDDLFEDGFEGTTF